MMDWIRHLDELLRGQRLNKEQLLKDKVDLRLRRFVPIAIVLGAIYGFFMGWYALFTRDQDAAMQVFASTLKLPALFLCTLAVTFPSLYVFNALIGCRMSFGSTLRVLVGAIVVNLAIAASLGPILAFFTVSTTNYAFMVLLNVALLGLAGFLSVGFLLRALRSLATARAENEAAARDRSEQPTAPEIPREPEQNVQANSPPTAPPIYQYQYGTPDRHQTGSPQESSTRAKADLILSVWLVIYIGVGTQMGWILRPFIGSPDAPFSWFRSRDGSFLVAFLGVCRRLLGVE